MAKLSLRQAAEVTGKSKSTISKALSTGKLSYVTKDDNGYQIDPSELFRVYPPKGFDEGIEGHLETPNSTSGNYQGNPLVSPEVELLRELAEERKARIETLEKKVEQAEARLEQERKEAKEERDKARDEREKLMLWLEHRPSEDAETKSEPPEEKTPPRRRWWQRKRQVEKES